MHKLVRDLYKTSPSDAFVRSLICALEDLLPWRSVNMDPFIFGETATNVVNVILESSVTWISSDTLVRMLKLGWRECVRLSIKKRVRARMDMSPRVHAATTNAADGARAARIRTGDG